MAYICQVLTELTKEKLLRSRKCNSCKRDSVSVQDDGKEDERSAGDHAGEPKFMNQDINANINMNQCSPNFYCFDPISIARQ